MKTAEYASETASYVETSKVNVPVAQLYWNCVNQGNIVQASYGNFGRTPGDIGSPYKRIVDNSDKSETYYIWQEPWQNLNGSERADLNAFLVLRNGGSANLTAEGLQNLISRGIVAADGTGKTLTEIGKLVCQEYALSLTGGWK